MVVEFDDGGHGCVRDVVKEGVWLGSGYGCGVRLKWSRWESSEGGLLIVSWLLKSCKVLSGLV